MASPSVVVELDVMGDWMWFVAGEGSAISSVTDSRNVFWTNFDFMTFMTVSAAEFGFFVLIEINVAAMSFVGPAGMFVWL